MGSSRYSKIIVWRWPGSFETYMIVGRSSRMKCYHNPPLTAPTTCHSQIKISSWRWSLCGNLQHTRISVSTTISIFIGSRWSTGAKALVRGHLTHQIHLLVKQIKPTNLIILSSRVHLVTLEVNSMWRLWDLILFLVSHPLLSPFTSECQPQ